MDCNRNVVKGNAITKLWLGCEPLANAHMRMSRSRRLQCGKAHKWEIFRRVSFIVCEARRFAKGGFNVVVTILIHTHESSRSNLRPLPNDSSTRTSTLEAQAYMIRAWQTSQGKQAIGKIFLQRSWRPNTQYKVWQQERQSTTNQHKTPKKEPAGNNWPRMIRFIRWLLVVPTKGWLGSLWVPHLQSSARSPTRIERNFKSHESLILYILEIFRKWKDTHAQPILIP